MSDHRHGEYKVPGASSWSSTSRRGRSCGPPRSAGTSSSSPTRRWATSTRRWTGCRSNRMRARRRGRRGGAAADGAQLFGFTAEAVGIAVRRALGKATGWRDHDCRGHATTVRSPAMHMALDEVLAREVGGGQPAADAALLGVGRRPPSSSAPSSRCATRSTRRAPPGTASTSCAGSPAAARCSWSRATCITYSLYVPGVAGRRADASRESYAFLDDWVLGALADVGIDGLVPAAQRHRHRRGQDRRRRAEAAGRRRGAAPRDDGLRHRRGQDARGAAHRPREDVATRAPAAPTSASTRCAAQTGLAPRGDHRRDDPGRSRTATPP